MSVTIRNDRRQNPYSQIDRAAINDPQLSLQATGLLAWVLAKPDDWRIDARQISTVKADGYKSVAAALRELRQAGYITRERVRDAGGRFIWETTVHETPNGVVHNSPVIHTPGSPQATIPPEGINGATSGNGETAANAAGRTIDPKPSDGFGAPLQIRETNIPARARAKGNGGGRAQESSTAPPVPGYSHGDNPGHDPDPAHCAACGTAAFRPTASREARDAALAALGVRRKWPEDRDAAPPPEIDMDAERARQLAALDRLTNQGELA